MNSKTTKTNNRTLSELTADDIAANFNRFGVVVGEVSWARWNADKDNGSFYINSIDGSAFNLFSNIKNGFPERGENVVCVCRLDCNTKEVPHITRVYPIAIYSYEDETDVVAVLQKFAKGISPKAGKSNDE